MALRDIDIETTANEMGSYLERFPEKPEIGALKAILLETLAFIRVNQAGTAGELELIGVTPVSPFRSALDTPQLAGLLVSDNSTTLYPRSRDIDDELLETLSLAHLDDLEHSEETEFAKKVLGFIDHYHSYAVDALSDYIEANPSKTDLAHEVLRLVGQSEDSPSQVERRQLLERNLLSHSPRIRYGAILGLAYMNDPNSVHQVKRVLEQEKTKVLRKILNQLLDQLQSTNV